jgi:hypothetical protein
VLKERSNVARNLLLALSPFKWMGAGVRLSGWLLRGSVRVRADKSDDTGAT